MAANSIVLNLLTFAIAIVFIEVMSEVSSAYSNCIVVPNAIPAWTVDVVVVDPKSLLLFKTQKFVSDWVFNIDKAVEFKEIEFKPVLHDV